MGFYIWWRKHPTYIPQLPDDSSTSEEEGPVPDHLKTTPEERIFGTIPGSPITTTVALMHSKAQANPIVPGSIKKRPKIFKKKKPTMALVPKSDSSETTHSTISTIQEKEDIIFRTFFKYGLQTLQNSFLNSV